MAADACSQDAVPQFQMYASEGCQPITMYGAATRSRSAEEPEMRRVRLDPLLVVGFGKLENFHADLNEQYGDEEVEEEEEEQTSPACQGEEVSMSEQELMIHDHSRTFLSSAELWNDIFDSLNDALIQASVCTAQRRRGILVASKAQSVAHVERLPTDGGAFVDFAAGLGERCGASPTIQLLALLGRGHMPLPEAAIRKACHWRDVLLRHCNLCAGNAAMALAAEAVRLELQGVVAASSTTSSSLDSSFGDDRQVLWGRSAREQIIKRIGGASVLQLANITRLEDVDFRFDVYSTPLPRTSLGSREDCDAGLVSVDSNAQLLEKVSSNVSLPHLLAPALLPTQRSLMTESGEQRLQFWKCYLNFRELGVVTREKLLEDLVKAPAADAPFRDILEKDITPLPPVPALSPRGVGPLSPDTLNPHAPSRPWRRVERDRRVRRPPPRTLLPRPRVAGPRRELRTKLVPAQPRLEEGANADHVEVADIELNEEVWQGEYLFWERSSNMRPPSAVLLPPMFMGGSDESQAHRNLSMAMPLLRHGIGFAKAPRAHSDRTTADSPSIQSFPPSPASVAQDRRSCDGDEEFELPTVGPPRCAYCQHHGLLPEAGADAPHVEPVQKQESRRHSIRSMRRRRVSCCVCGDNVLTDFRPRSLFFDALPPVENVRAEIEATVEPQGASPKCVTQGAASFGMYASETLDFGAGGRQVHPSIDPQIQQELSSEIPSATDGSEVYFVACEHMQARPTAAAAAALGASIAADVALGWKENELAKPTTVSLRGAGSDGRGLMAFLQSVRQQDLGSRSRLVRVDLAGNQLENNDVHDLIEQLKGLSWLPKLELLDLGGNRLLTHKALAPLGSLMASTKLPNLCVLRVSGVDLGDASAVELFDAIDAGNSSILVDLDISFTGLGRGGPAGPEAVAALVRQCADLRALDVSGNYFQGDVIAKLGSALVETSRLQVLHMAYNVSGCVVAGGSTARVHLGGPLVDLCELLPRMRQLRLLDLRASQVDQCCAFTLAHALSLHDSLEAVLLNRNPLGVYGLRALLTVALLAPAPMNTASLRSRNAYKAVANERLSVVTIDPIAGDQHIVFGAAVPAMAVSFADPSGSYVLDLSSAFSRAVVGYCLQRWDKLPSSERLTFDQAFLMMEVDGKALRESLARDEDGIWSVPQVGVMSFTFLLNLPTIAQDVDPQSSWCESARHRCRQTMLPWQESRLMEVVAPCRDPQTLLAIVQAIAADFHVPSLVGQTLSSWILDFGLTKPDRSVLRSLALTLVDAMVEGSADQPLVQRQQKQAIASDVPENEGDSARWILHLFDQLSPGTLTSRPLQEDPQTTVEFVVFTQPTGHYVLNLASPCEKLVAERLLLLSVWVSTLRRKRCLPDVSQVGNYQCLRNEALASRHFKYSVDWLPPDSGVLEFDLSVPLLAFKTEKPLQDESWDQMIEVFMASELPYSLRALCLRRISSKLCISCQQLAKILQRISKVKSAASGAPRSESKKLERVKPTEYPKGQYLVEDMLLTTFFYRLTDQQKAWVTLFSGEGAFAKPIRFQRVRAALGLLNLVNPLQFHHHPVLRLSLDVHEDRQTCRLVVAVQLAEAKGGIDSKRFTHLAYGLSERTLEPMATFPRAWISEGLPTVGILCLGFAPKLDGSFNERLRKALLQRFVTGPDANT